MSTLVWIATIILLLIVISVAVILFVKTPKSKAGIHILAITPLLLGVAYNMVLPEEILFTSDSTSIFFRTVIPFMSVILALPLVIKANKEIKKKEQ
ncbi:hypothetical protein [Virgibacillus sp. JSM 102003]|uniref:hypothetical protein n=1 Tax=Virgibacillus sp. JSM 102003 TaxID=1562108 RepID=UPI0035BF82A5